MPYLRRDDVEHGLDGFLSGDNPRRCVFGVSLKKICVIPAGPVRRVSNLCNPCSNIPPKAGSLRCGSIIDLISCGKATPTVLAVVDDENSLHIVDFILIVKGFKISLSLNGENVGAMIAQMAMLIEEHGGTVMVEDQL